ncbi:MAG: pantetheine-phosphate adenylyltransferase [Desulfobacteraceae bacterium]|nr:pantetheine-phosphate adenylyltransferase [Desulfobacteraceae bacterium]
MISLAVYPGSFDPITNGHLDLLERGLKVFDKILIAIARNAGKKPLFSIDERVELIEDSLRGRSYEDRLEVVSFDGLLVDYVRKVNAKAILRGLRAISDFEYEFPMSLMNRKLNEEVETFFLMTGLRYNYISSTIIKEVVISGGSVSGLVPEPVERKLREKFMKLDEGSSDVPRVVVPLADPKLVLRKKAS